MSLYIIGDLHLSFGESQKEEKPMNIFGGNWENHAEKIRQNWIETVKENDTVILAGDFSWATYLKDTYEDFKFINGLPGKKIMLKGNHDYWWTTITSMKKYLEENGFSNIEFLHNNSFKIENKIIVGTRGWTYSDSDNSEKMMNREAERLELSIKDALQKFENYEEIICIMHYPPVSKLYMKNEYLYDSKFLELMKKYDIKRCYYGHLHGKSHQDAIEGNVEGIELKLISSDFLGFKLHKIIDK